MDLLLSHVRFIVVLGLAFLSARSCTPKPIPQSTSLPQTPTTTILPMNGLVHIHDLLLDKAFYPPGEQVRLTLMLENQTNEPATITTQITIRHLADPVATIDKEIHLVAGVQEVEISFLPPGETPRGYGIEACLTVEDGKPIACASTAFDVLQHWTQMPRYGFLSDFDPGRTDIPQTLHHLTQFHLNGLQFYDWMYRHDQFLTDQDPYTDPLDRSLSRTTIARLISAAHEHNIAAMPYTAIYAASVPFYENHREWALYQAHGEPHLLGEDFLVYMDPRPTSPWVKHLMAQFDQVLSEMDFDGIHLDQYGDPKEAYDAQGHKFSLAEPLAATINVTKDLVRAHRPEGAVVFNAVTNWPIETVAPSKQDFIYIEVWPPYRWYDDLHKLIIQAQALGGGKPVVLAAYIDPAHEHNVRLVDAVIFASGGGHIELGENLSMLADPYFPNYKTMPPGLMQIIRQYYDFAVRFQEVIGPSTKDVSQDYLRCIELETVSTQPNILTNKVWPIVRSADGSLAINLINLLGVDSPEWASAVARPPNPLGQTTIRLLDLEHEVSRIWFTSPDFDEPAPQILSFTQYKDGDHQVLTFQIPYLAYWDLVVIEWSE